MKKILTMMSLALGLGISIAQVNPVAQQRVEVAHQKQAMHKAEKSTEKQMQANYPAGTVLKKDGTPDKRYKNNKKLKKDGTPDRRFK